MKKYHQIMKKCTRCKKELNDDMFLSLRDNKTITKMCSSCRKTGCKRAVTNRKKDISEITDGKQTCTHCKISRDTSEFIGKYNKNVKTCSSCRAACNRNRKKCIHGKNKYYCIDCDGKGMCEHNKQKHSCVICRVTPQVRSKCEHDQCKYNCLICGGFDRIAKNMVSRNLRNDRLKGRYPENPITVEYVNELLSKINSCIYCETNFTYEGRKNPDFVSLERIDDTIGHDIDNVTLCCYKCNISHMY